MSTNARDSYQGLALTLGLVGLVGLAGMMKRGSANSSQRMIEFGELGDDFGVLIVYAKDGTVDRFYVVDGKAVSFFRHRPHMAPDSSKPWSMREVTLARKPESLTQGIESALEDLMEISPSWVDWTEIPAAESVFA